MKDLSKIKLLICDCDGVLSDGLIIYSDEGAEIKHFSTHDGLGIKILSHTDIKIAVVTGRKSRTLKRRCADLNINLLYQNVKNKKRVIDELLSQLDLKWDNVAYIGDDWNDYLAMQASAFKAVPANAFDNFKMTADYVTERKGGYGAVREVIEFILKSRNEFEATLEKFLNELQNA
ncbi:MAG: HAD hydrolase family protein [Candidatus Cloacimonetes bacterium]|jgi:YrbI family 3-deoxy-D-manno-octulosonate 8-phosphate phosphatase|nr:HAD hydrolase family protein [Candidatus Cloacimonadota bacterium]MDD4155828.1 HAD hydrolase family protein [Candidatus Cloacimonadota bacterium]